MMDTNIYIQVRIHMILLKSTTMTTYLKGTAQATY